MVKAGEAYSKKKNQNQTESDLVAQTVPDLGLGAKRLSKKSDGGARGGTRSADLQANLIYGWEINAGFGVA